MRCIHVEQRHYNTFMIVEEITILLWRNDNGYFVITFIVFV